MPSVGSLLDSHAQGSNQWILGEVKNDPTWKTKNKISNSQEFSKINGRQ